MKENSYDLTSIIAPASHAAAEQNVATATNPENGLNLVSNEDTYAQFSFSSSKQYVYYTFNTNFIPSNATIIGVSASLRARRGSSGTIKAQLGYFNADYGASSRSFYTVGNEISIASSTTTVYDIASAGSNSWDPAKLSRINLRFYVSGSYQLYFYGCSLTIHYQYDETIYEITSINQTTLIGEIYPDGLLDVYPQEQTSPYTLTLVGDSLDDIIVTDTNYSTGTITDVTNQLQEHPSNIGYNNASFVATSASLVGTAYITTSGSSFQNTSLWFNPVNHSVENPSETTYNVFRRSAQSYNSYVDYKFDFSSILFTSEIPDKTVRINDSSIIISDVSVVVRGKYENDSQVNVAYRVSNVRLYSGDIAKSETLEFTSTNYQTLSFAFPGKWTIQELQNAYLRFTFGVSGGHIAGITWYVNYIIEPDYPRYWTYTLPTANQDHEIIINDSYQGTKYTVDTIVYYKSRVSVSNTHMVLRSDSEFNVTIYTDDFDHVRILEVYNGENIDMTDSEYVSRMPYANDDTRFKENTYIYTIPSVTSNHTIKIVEMEHYSVNAQSLIDNINITVSANKVYIGEDCTISISTDSLSNILIQDNNEDITSMFTRTATNTYTAVIQNVQEDHDILVVENSKQILLSLSNSEDIRISPNGYNSVQTGSSQEFIIISGALTMMLNGRPSKFTQPKRTVSFENIILKDNGVDVTDKMRVMDTNKYSYLLNDINEQHTIIVYELLVPDYEDPNYNYYSLSISSLNAVTLPTTGTVRVVEGSDYTVTIQPTVPNIIVTTDNDEDISDQFQKTYLPDIYIEADPSYTVSDMTSTYKFIKNENTGYYISNNNTIQNSQAVARVTFVLPVSCNVEIGYINYAEPNGDYAIFGNIDSALNAGSASYVDSDVFYTCAAVVDHQAYEQSLIYTIPAGEHFIDIKYQKNVNATHRNNDSLQFRIKDIQATEAYVQYTYTVENIQNDHSLVFVFGDSAYYTVDATGTNSRLYPYGTMIKLPEQSYNLTIIPNIDLYKIVLTDNGYDKSNSITKLEAMIDDQTIVNYIYSLNRVNDNHIIEVICKNPYEFFLKRNNIWGTVSKVYKKINDEWTLIYDYTAEFLADPNIVRMFKESVD